MAKKKKKISKKAQKVLDVLLEKSRCPHCKTDLGKGGIGWTEHGECVYKVDLEGNHLSYEQDEFMNDGDGNFYCQHCGDEIDLSQEEVIKILEAIRKETYG